MHLVSLFLHFVAIFSPSNSSCLPIYLHGVPLGNHFFTLDPTWLLFCISQIQCGCLWLYYSWFDSVTSFQACTNKHIDQPQKIASCQIDILELLKSSQLCHIEKLKKKTLQSTRKIVPLKILVTIGLETCHPPGCAPRKMDGKLQFPS